ncbi:MAG: Uncharacterised protein [Flavobacteriales bacterium]|jgi:uncharacterized protein YaaR (DUF327 family)|nr:MAG: hypothetical protein DBW73_02170 [Flavobacteriales bacterium]CAI8301857.1 MAG: Uncharacterised protein [Flavobacteriales bacterium]|tara:strand:+ start:946 stop:1212 length:267 start_codon:yes stop_codon:yes gene_type:complete
MATIRDLKKDINHVLGEIIEMTLDWEKANPKADRKASAAIVDEAISTYESFSTKIYQKEVENKKAHFRAIQDELTEKGNALIEKLNAL